MIVKPERGQPRVWSLEGGDLEREREGGCRKATGKESVREKIATRPTMLARGLSARDEVISLGGFVLVGGRR